MNDICMGILLVSLSLLAVFVAGIVVGAVVWGRVAVRVDVNRE